MNTQKPKPDIRELTLSHGISFPSDEELVMLMLGKGTRDMPVEKLAQRVCATLAECTQSTLVERLKTIPGMGDAKALTIAAAIELGRRRTIPREVRITTPSDIVPYVKHYAMEQREHFICASLNGAREIIQIRVVSVGTPPRTMVHPREIYAEPVAEHASGIICCHNHPCGPCLPSDADRESTRTLQKAAYILGMTFLDHIIITKEDYFSFLEHQLL